MTKRGVLIASDSAFEIFMPWWYEHYRKHNDLPVAIVDLGLSDKGRKWANHIGICIPGPRLDIDLQVHQSLDPSMQGMTLHAEQAQSAWGKKPTACTLSPFDQTLWIDLDCQVRCDVAPLFQTRHHFSAARDQPHYERWCQEKEILQPGMRGYDSGVMVFDKTSPVIRAWIAATASWDRSFWGDDRILSHIIHQKKLTVQEIPSTYNANPWQHPDAKILHWATAHGKAEILRQMILTEVAR